jgi:hypothetical protein
MDSVFDLLVRTDRTGSSVGLFGRARAHYGTIENQGRGSLHTHALVWLHGQLSPLEAQKRLSEVGVEFHEWRTRLLQVRFVGFSPSSFFFSLLYRMLT